MIVLLFSLVITFFLPPSLYQKPGVLQAVLFLCIFCSLPRDKKKNGRRSTRFPDQYYKKSENTLLHHGIGHLKETGNVSAGDQVIA